jgi:exonuclease III
MKFISWNIDSLNAALTSDSPRALLTRDVLKKIASENADIIAIQETKLPEAGMNAKQEAALSALFPDYEVVFVSSCPPARKGYAGTMALEKKGLAFKADNDDIRESLSFKVKKLLEMKMAEVLVTDEFVPGTMPLKKFVKEAEGVILGVPHSAYKRLKLKQPFVDCWGCWARG